MAEQSERGEALLALLLRLRAAGVSDARLLAALETTPHEDFVPSQYHASAWSGRSLPLSCGQVMPPVDLTCRLLDAAQIASSHAVLEIGTGSGYQTALLSRLAKKVHSIDRYRTLLERARSKLALHKVENVTMAQLDGATGVRADGLYDRIVIDSAYDAMPRDLLDRLTSGGVVVTAIGEPMEEQIAVRLTKVGSRFDREDLFPVRLSPLESGIAEAL